MMYKSRPELENIVELMQETIKEISIYLIRADKAIHQSEEAIAKMHRALWLLDHPEESDL